MICYLGKGHDTSSTDASFELNDFTEFISHVR